jgi:glucosamine--fructose-6-phosphate aminotransferase (isomerizing)
VKLIDYYEKKYNQGPLYSLTHAMQRIRGSYALAVMFKNYPDTIYAARKDSPMVIGIAEGASYLASDVTPILNYTKTVYFIGNEQVAELNKGSVKFFNLDQEEVEIEPKEVTWDAEAAEKNGYEHFMIKEIHEQPKAVKDTLKSVIKDGKIDLSEVGIDKETAEKLNNIIIVACGSAYHVGVVGQYVIESASRIPVRVELASEFRYRDPIMNENDLVIVISQSGETADSLAALRLAKKMNIKTLGIVNVVGSSIAREADYVFYTLAGPEIAVATTKAYSAQLIAIYALAIQLGKYREIIDENRYTSLIEEMETLPEKMERVLSDKERIQWFASKYANAQDMYFIGRGIDYAVSLEGSLKMKEISYVHSEAYAAGEIKHGPISLIEDGTLVIGICTDKKLFEKTRSNMVEVKSRGAYLMGLTSYGNYSIEDTADFTVYIPQTDPYFTTSLAIIPLQLLGYYLSVAKGLNVDKPRNLAKSVTVE